jgi:hypothetical protein
MNPSLLVRFAQGLDVMQECAIKDMIKMPNENQIQGSRLTMFNLSLKPMMQPIGFLTRVLTILSQVT